MRRMCLALLLSGAFLVAHVAVASAQGSSEGFSNGYLDAGPVIGLGNLGAANVSVGGRVEYGFKELPQAANGVLGIQVGVNYYHYSYDIFNTDYGITYIPIVGTVNYHFRLQNKKLDPFVGAGIGFWHVSSSGCPSCSFSSGGYAVARGGIRYFYTPRMALYADVGAGDAALNLGLMFKLSN
jgi:hypothetical protein